MPQGGTTTLGDDGKLIIDTPFVDAMIDEAARLDISISVRLQGYAVNLRNFKDVLMVDSDGNPQDTSVWLDFINTTLCHEGILEDNRLLSSELSAHYAKKENVIGFQIYNEPHFPGKMFFDYHPSTIEAYRKWLVKMNIMSEMEAKDYNPPKSRKEQDARMWAIWRLFSQSCISNFLENAAKPAKDATGLPAFTCLTPCTLFPSSAYRGADLFANARSCMDVLGYTCYYHSVGAEYYSMNHFLDLTASAAASEGKEAWCVELDSRTYIPLDVFNKNTFAVLGSGTKGIMYYQWRGDYPSPATPIPNGCGLLNYDGTKVENFDNADKMVKYINRMSDMIIDTKRHNNKIGVLHSDYAAYMCDALDNADESRIDKTLTNAYNMLYKEVYTELRKKGYTVNIEDALSLKKGTLGTEILFIANSELLSDEEKAVVEEFIAKGGKVFENISMFNNVNVGGAYVPYGTKIVVYAKYYTLDELQAEFLPNPFAVSSNPLVATQALDGDGYKFITLTNITCSNKTQSLKLTVDMDVKKAVMYTTDGEKELEISDGIIEIENLADGAIVKVE